MSGASWIGQKAPRRELRYDARERPLSDLI